VVAVNEAAIRPDRLARFREAAGKMDEALREEGFDEHGSHAIFVRWQRESVEGLGGILLEAEKTMGERVDTACARIEEASRRFRDDEFRRAKILLTSGQDALSMARQAADTAAATGERAEQVFNASVAKIARELSVKLLDECQQWLVLKQTQRNRRDAWRLAVGVAAAALMVFVGGYATAGWRQDKETEAERAVFAAVERCWKKPVTAQDASGAAIEMCRLQDLLPRRGG
jgi:hypothetical protein